MLLKQFARDESIRARHKNMYSGDKVLYAVKMSPKDCMGFLITFCLHNNVNVRDDFVHEFFMSEARERRWMLHDVMESILSKGYFKHITVLAASCCNYDNIMYVGVELGRNHIAYRDTVEDFNGFQDYMNYYTKSIELMEKKLKQFKDEYDKEIHNLVGVSCPKIYSMANDCENCT